MRVWAVWWGLLAGFLAAFGSALAGEVPDGSYLRPVHADCWPERSMSGLDPASGRPMKAQASVVQSWVDRCGQSWKAEPQDSLYLLFQFAGLNYPLRQGYLKSVTVPLSDSRRLSAMLARKPGGKARDLIVFRCGIFCDAAQGSLALTTLLAAFEDNPAHLLILGSTSGAQWARDNGSSQIGGFDEGFQNLEAAQWMMSQQANLGIKVRRIHFMGASLGGLATLFSSIYYNATPAFQDLPVGAFLAVCPLVDARAQFNGLSSLPVATMAFQRQLRDLFGQILPFLPPAQRGLVNGGDELGSALDLSADYYSRNWERLAFSRFLDRPGGGARLTRENLLEASNLFTYRNRFSARTLVLHAQDDMIVPWRGQAQRLLSIQDQNLGVVRVDHGNHCAFGQGMGWATYSQFLTRAFSLQGQLAKRQHGVPPTAAAYFAGDTRWETVYRSHYQWQVRPGARAARLKVWHFLGHLDGCADQKPTFADPDRQCQREESIEVPLSELASLGIPAQAGDAYRAGRIERYLNVRARFKTAAGALAVGVREAPASLETTGSFHPDFGVL